MNAHAKDYYVWPLKTITVRFFAEKANDYKNYKRRNILINIFII
jgi:hypothetical protein